MNDAVATEFDVMNPDPLRRVELALDDLRAGRAVILIDDEDRENEGDLVVAAERITPELINFMAVHARGLVCLSITAEQVRRLGLPMMAQQNNSAYNTAFTVSIEAREGVTTGISAADRSRTVQVAIRPDATPRDIVTPGHMFPLRARDGGVLERVGQTEGSVDLARIAGLLPAAVICEIIKDDGTMARLPDLLEFGARHHIRVVAVADVIRYRMRHERLVGREETGTLDVRGIGAFQVALYRDRASNGLHLAVWRGPLGPNATLVRVQPAPPAWAGFDPDASASSRSAHVALAEIARAGSGALVLMHVDGGGLDAIAESFRRDFAGRSTSRPQARADALRSLGTGCQILLDLGLRDLRLLSSSDRSIVGIDAYGLRIVERVPLRVSAATGGAAANEGGA